MPALVTRRRPRLNVFTPLPPEATDIATVNVTIILALAAHADITVWVAQDVWIPIEHPALTIRSFRSDAVSYIELNDTDANIFHIGNNVDYHQDIFDLCLVVPGIVVLHDTNLYHLMLGLCHGMGRHDTFVSAAWRCHGDKGSRLAQRLLAGDKGEDVIDGLPMTLAPAACATALVVHNQEVKEALDRQTAIPVYMLPLAYNGSAFPATRSRRDPRPPYRIILFGYLSSNRRVETILRVLADSDVRDQFTVEIYGSYFDPKALDALIAVLDLAQQTSVFGFVPLAVLDEALATADLAINLRFPTVGEASASQLRIWAHGLPSIVTRIGWYAQQSDAYCHFVEMQTETADLHHALIDFCCNPHRWRRMGEAARDYVRRTHGADLYAWSLLSIVRQQTAALRAEADRNLVDRLHRRTLPADLGDALSQRLATMLASDKAMTARQGPTE